MKPAAATRRAPILGAVAAVVCAACGPRGTRGIDLDRVDMAWTLPGDTPAVTAISPLGTFEVALLHGELGSMSRFDLRDGKPGPAQTVATITTEPLVGLLGAEGSLRLIRRDGTVRQVLEKRELLGVLLDVEILSTLELPVGAVGWRAVARDPLSRGVVLLDVRARPDLTTVWWAPAHGGPPRRLFDVSVFDLAAQAQRRRLPLPTLHDAGGNLRPAWPLRFTGIAAHAGTHDVWLLAAADRAVLVFDRGGGLLAVHRFAEEAGAPPTAMAFLADGRLALLGAGADGAAVLRLYR